MDLEGSAMRHPTDPRFIVRIREDGVNFLTESHVLDGNRTLVVFGDRHLGEITVGVIGCSARSADGLDASRFEGGAVVLGHDECVCRVGHGNMVLRKDGVF